MNYSEEIAHELNELLQKNYDTERAYKSAADDIENVQLKALFEELAEQRYDFGHELKAEILDFDGSPDKGSSTKGDFARAWMDVKSALSDHKEETVLKEVEKGEEAALKEYNEVMIKGNFPPSTENLLIKQRNAIQMSLSKIKGLKKTFVDV